MFKTVLESSTEIQNLFKEKFSKLMNKYGIKSVEPQEEENEEEYEEEYEEEE